LSPSHAAAAEGTLLETIMFVINAQCVLKCRHNIPALINTSRHAEHCALITKYLEIRMTTVQKRRSGGKSKLCH